MGYSKLMALIVLLIFFPFQVCAWTYTNAEGDEIAADYGDPSFYKAVDYSNPNIEWDQFDQSKVPSDRIGMIPADKVDILKVSDKSKLTQYQLGVGDNLNKLKNWKGLNEPALNGAVSKKTGKDVSIKGAGNGEIKDNQISLDSAQFFQIDQNSITNGIGIRFDGNQLFFDHADSVITDKSVSTNVDSFSGYANQFSIESADSVNVGCIRFDDVRNSTIIAASNGAKLQNTNGTVTITDCSYAKSEFESLGNGSVTLDKDGISPTYSLYHGRLTCIGDLNETLEAQSTASVNYGSSCFECISITPIGSYYYNDPIIEKDFVITVPKEGKEYRLCLKKSPMQEFSLYDGIVDFTQKSMKLNGVVQYKRYPLKNGKISGLLTKPVYFGKSNISMSLRYLPDFTFIDALRINGILGLNSLESSETTPSNFISFSETSINGKKTRVAKINYLLSKESMNQGIISTYDSDDDLPPITYANGAYTQDNGKTRVEILEPEHERIQELLT